MLISHSIIFTCTKCNLSWKVLGLTELNDSSLVEKLVLGIKWSRTSCKSPDSYLGHFVPALLVNSSLTCSLSLSQTLNALLMLPMMFVIRCLFFPFQEKGSLSLISIQMLWDILKLIPVTAFSLMTGYCIHWPPLIPVFWAASLVFYSKGQDIITKKKVVKVAAETSEEMNLVWHRHILLGKKTPIMLTSCSSYWWTG